MKSISVLFLLLSLNAGAAELVLATGESRSIQSLVDTGVQSVTCTENKLEKCDLEVADAKPEEKCDLPGGKYNKVYIVTIGKKVMDRFCTASAPGMFEWALELIDTYRAKRLCI
jgi:hypothetical protein